MTSDRSSSLNAADLVCCDCKRPVGGDVFFTLINPEGGYDSPQALACDDCMRSGRWDHWIAEHWPNWPEKR